MWQCPVCETNNSQLQCKKCGFDGSCDYEQYPTLGNPNGRVDAVSRRKAARQAAEAGTLSCPNCGGKQFSVDFEKQLYLCSSCGNRFSPKKAEEKPEEKKTAQKNTVITEEKTNNVESFAERVRSMPRVGAFGIPGPWEQGREKGEPPKPQKQPEKKEKRQRPKGVKFMLRLGWVYLIYQTICYLNANDQSFILMDDPVLEKVRYAFLGLTILMQLRLIMKDFEPTVHKPAMWIDFILLFVQPFVLLFFVPSTLISMNILSLALLIMAIPYHLIFYFGMKTVAFAPVSNEKDAAK